MVILRYALDDRQMTQPSPTAPNGQLLVDRAGETSATDDSVNSIVATTPTDRNHHETNH